MELLVVIAIIGLLISIVTVSIRSSRSKGTDTGVKRGLSELQKQAEIYYYENSNSYSGLCATNKVQTQLANTAKSSGITTVNGNGVAGAWNQATCHDSVREWAAEVPMADSVSDNEIAMWCVDGAGKAEKTTTVFVEDTIVCPTI